MDAAVLYLTVPYKDKDIVKALGARWDGKNRRWFVPSGSEGRFARWIKDGGLLASGTDTGAVVQVEGRPRPLRSESEATQPKAGERVGASLSSVLFEASEAVRKALPIPRWIIAEVASIRTHPHSGHTYVELVEHDDTGREMAKANARVWSGSARILRRFEKETGGKVIEGMKLLVLAQADFSIQYGFGLTIEDIDPAWTLGEMQRKIVQIRDRLVAEGVFEKNAKLRPVADFVSVAVVAPDGAAGLGDFMADAKLLIDAGLCQFHFLPAVFEGPSALMSVVSALALAKEMAERAEIDAVVVVRGGGAKTSLNWLNEYEMARQICAMPVPVMVGVGHERDATILDEVACESFDTPSKVVGAIYSRVVGNAQLAKFALDQLTSGVRQACSFANKEAVALRADVERSARRALAKERSAIAVQLSEVKSLIRGSLRESKSELDGLAREVVGLGPAASLQRGYCVASQNGKTRGRVAEMRADVPIVLRMADGEVEVTMKKERKK